jgi:hypothetical protein
MRLRGNLASVKNEQMACYVGTRTVDQQVDENGLTMSVGDGIPDFMLEDVLDAAEGLGMTGLTCFIDLNGYARKVIRDGDLVRVKAISGTVYHTSNGRPLSNAADPNLPDGSHMMSSKGIIHVRSADPEFRSEYKSKMSAAIASGAEEFDEAIVF